MNNELLHRDTDLKAFVARLHKESIKRYEDCQIRAEMMNAYYFAVSQYKEDIDIDKRFAKKFLASFIAFDKGFEGATIELDRGNFGDEFKITYEGITEHFKLTGWNDARIFISSKVIKLNKGIYEARFEQLKEVAPRTKAEIKKQLTKVTKALQKLVDEIDVFQTDFHELQYEIKIENMQKPTGKNEFVHLHSLVER